MNKNRCNKVFGCTYSKSMDQEYPRKCIKCGHPEPIAQDNVGASIIEEFTVQHIAQLLSIIHHRNEIIKARRTSLTSEWEMWNDMILQINSDIKKILQLT